MNKQAWRFLLASLLFVLAACSQASEGSETQLPTAVIEHATPTATVALEATPGSHREEVMTYPVVKGDTISSIAEMFDLQPETVLWANYDLLLDDPDYLLVDMQLTILPVDGIYHQAGGTDSVQSLAAFFAADPQAIIDWSGNAIDANNPVIFAGQWIMVPGGERQLRRRFMPNLSSNSMAVDNLEYGVGACPENVSLDVSPEDNYVWPVDDPTVRGDSFWSAHPALDLAIDAGGEVHAANDGIVVFAGWSNLGYGNMIMLDHGNGDFTLYGGLSTLIATCGSLVQQGDAIAIGGMTGHSAEPFVHFELRRGEEFLDPAEVISS
jgi:hypothetical protein